MAANDFREVTDKNTTRKERSANTAFGRVWFSHTDKENILISVHSKVGLHDLFQPE